MAKSLIVYYSLGGKTKKVVDILEKLTNADVYEIEMEKPYTKLTAYTIGLGHCRIGYEPPIKNGIDLSAYNKIFIGGPTWWFTYAPPINSFIKKYDLTDKQKELLQKFEESLNDKNYEQKTSFMKRLKKIFKDIID